MKEVLRTIIIAGNSEAAEHLEQALKPLQDGVQICRTLPGYPSLNELMRVMRAHGPDAVFLNFENSVEARAMVDHLEAAMEGIQIIAFHSSCDAGVLRETMQAGIREFLSEPFQTEDLVNACGHVRTRLERKPVQFETTQQAYVFVPSKAGVGASTIALNTSAAFARRSTGRVILADFDLNSGMMRFLLKISNQYCILDAIEHAERMDENLWPQLVTPFDKLDVLHSGNINPNLRIETSRVRDLIEFMRRNYQTLCFDVSGNLERYSLELMEECKHIVLVCTSELAPLHLAKEKLAFLRSIDLGSKVLVVLNRTNSKAALSKEHVEDVLGTPVSFSFPNDYPAIQAATTSARVLESTSSMGKRFVEFSEILSGQAHREAPVKRRFLERFVLPAAGIVRTEE